MSQYTKVEMFGAGEQIVCAGEHDTAFYILLGGRVILSIDSKGKQQEIARLSEGDFLGETVFLPQKPSPVSATVTNTAGAIAIAPVAISHSVQQSPQFALEISQFIDERKRLIGIPEGIETSTNSRS